MANNFGNKIAITGFVWTIATGLLVTEGFELSANKTQILRIPCN